MALFFLFFTMFSCQVFADSCEKVLINKMADVDSKVNVIYYSEAEQQAKKITFIDGKFYQSDRLLTTGARGYIFIVTLDGQMIAAASIARKIHHTTLSGGQDVLTAGWFAVTNGVLMALSNESGHYKPTSGHLRLTRQFLLDKNVSFDRTTFGDFSRKADGEFSFGR